MKMKKFKFVVLSSLVLSTLAQPVGVLATEINNNSEVQAKGVSTKAISNPNLMNISSKSKVTDTNIWGNPNRWQTVDWYQGSNINKIKGNRVGFTSVTGVSGGQIFKLSDYQFTVYDNEKINMRYNGSLIGDSSFGVGQDIKTEIGKEYTFSTNYIFDSKVSTLKINVGDKVINIENAGMSGSREVTFVATESTTYFQVYYNNGTTVDLAATLDKLKIVKSASQVAIEELQQLLPTFFDKDGNLGSKITATDLAKAQAFLNKVTAGTEKTKLQATFNKATELLNQRNALATVTALFENNDVTSESIKETVTQASIDSAKNTINKVTDTTKKAELMTYLLRAQEFLNQNQAVSALSNLFVDNNPRNDLKENVTYSMITAASTLVDKVTDEERKAGLQEGVKRAQDLLAVRIEEETNQAAAENAINGMFKENNPATEAIIEGLTQATIDEATALANKVTDETKKASLLASVTKVQELLTERLAEEAKVASIREQISNLFQDNDVQGSIRTDLTQEEIDRVVPLVETIKDSDIQSELNNQIANAQKGLNALNAEKEDNAEAAVNGLFQNNDPTTASIKGGLTQDMINKATTLTSQVLDADKKAEYQANISLAQLLFDERNAEADRQVAATEAVNALFVGKNPASGEIIAGLTQDTINAAQALIDTVTAPSKKEALQNTLKKAQNLLTSRIEEENRQKLATSAVNALFKNNDPTTGKIVSNLTDKLIDDAEILVNKVTNSSVKAALLEIINQAEELLEERNIENNLIATAEKEVNALFENNNPATGTIVEGLTQEHIDSAKAAVNKVKTEDKKAELLVKIETAQKELAKQIIEESNQAAATKAVNELFEDSNPAAGIIKESLTQKDIDSAKELILLITDQAKKDELTNQIKTAEDALNGKAAEAENQIAATDAVNNLFVENSSESNALKEIVKQDTIDSAQALLNKVKDATIKAELQEKVNLAQKLFDAIKNDLLKPVINAVGPFQQAITGTVPVGTVMVRLLVNGVPQRTAAPDAEGNFTIYSRFVTDGVDKTLRLQAGDKVTIDYGVKGNPLLASTVEVNKDFVKPLVNPVAPNAEYVTGIVPVGSQVIRLLVNGVPQRTANSQADINSVVVGGIDMKTGKFRIYSRIIKDENGKSRKLQAGDQVTIDSGVQIPGATGTTVTVTE